MQLEEARDRAIAAGITINGLTLVDPKGKKDPHTYYANHVVGGAQDYLLQVAQDYEDFSTLVTASLVWQATGGGGDVGGGDLGGGGGGIGDDLDDAINAAQTPEPGTMLLLGSAGGLIAYLRRRRRKESQDS